mmetsp:Transcript_41476/g.117459  ORF Transcript_41476/g.117459 Transcript_41476/m.117459 type:complete len:231 (-) Transcript_41476:30-722(-)
MWVGRLLLHREAGKDAPTVLHHKAPVRMSCHDVARNGSAVKRHAEERSSRTPPLGSSRRPRPLRPCGLEALDAFKFHAAARQELGPCWRLVPEVRVLAQPMLPRRRPKSEEPGQVHKLHVRQPGPGRVPQRAPDGLLLQVDALVEWICAPHDEFPCDALAPEGSPHDVGVRSRPEERARRRHAAQIFDVQVLEHADQDVVIPDRTPDCCEGLRRGHSVGGGRGLGGPAHA